MCSGGEISNPMQRSGHSFGSVLTELLKIYSWMIFFSWMEEGDIRCMSIRSD